MSRAKPAKPIGKLLPPGAVLRPGEGVRAIKIREKVGDATVSLDLSQIPVPDKQYTANAGAVFADPTTGGYRLVFAQTKTGGVAAGLRTMIDIAFSRQSVEQFLSSSNELQSSLDKLRLDPAPLLTEVSEPDQAVGMYANIAPIAFAGDDACIDFYSMSPFVAHALKSGGDAHVQGVVRVMLPTRVLVAVMKELERLQTGSAARQLVEKIHA